LLSIKRLSIRSSPERKTTKQHVHINPTRKDGNWHVFKLNNENTLFNTLSVVLFSLGEKKKNKKTTTTTITTTTKSTTTTGPCHCG